MTEKPPFPFKNPVEGYLRLTADGQWLYKDEPLAHEGLVYILESNYGPGPEGGYEVRLGPQRVVVEVEDTPYFVKDVDVNPEGSVMLRLNDGSKELLDPSRVTISENGHTYVTVKDGAEAKFLRKAELRLGDFVEEQEDTLGLRVAGKWTPLEERPSV